MANDDKYGPVTKVSDIGRNNRLMRAKVKKAKTRKELTKIYRESLYLYTLSKTKAWKDNFRGKITKLRSEIKRQFTLTAKAINKRAGQIGTSPNYDTKIN